MSIYVGVSKNNGKTPPKWMVKIRENPIKMDDLGVKHPFKQGFPLFSPSILGVKSPFFGNIHVTCACFFLVIFCTDSDSTLGSITIKRTIIWAKHHGQAKSKMCWLKRRCVWTF